MEPERVVGRYRIVASVGRGGSGEVFRAIGPDGWEVALKLLHTHGVTEVQKKRLVREAKALLRLGDHPNVVRIVDAGEDRGRPFLALAWVPSESLEARLEREGPHDPRTAAVLVAKLARAVAHCHAQGVLHRDLKPGNVLVRAWDGEPLLTDFGLTRDLEGSADATALTVMGRFLGTPGYWSPEQAQGEHDKVGPATDVWGLGGVLHALLTGKPPVPGESLLEVLAALEREPGPPSLLRPGIPAALDAACHRCLALDPARRWPDAAALASELERWANGVPAAPPLRPWRLGVLVGAVALLGAAAAGFAAWPRGAEPAASVLAATASAAPSSPPVSALLPPPPVQSPIHPDLQRARALDRECEFEEAMLLARQLAEDDALEPGTRYEALLLLADLLPESRLEHLRRAFALLPERPEARSRLALGLIYSGDAGARAQGQRLMDEASGPSADHPDALRVRAVLLWELGKSPADPAILARAEGLLRRAIELDPHDAEAWSLLAWVERDRPRPEEARAAWKQAWQLRQPPEPAHEAATHFTRAGRALREGLEREWDPQVYRRALAVLTRALSENPRHSQALGERARLSLLVAARLPQANRPEALGRILGELAWSWRINPMNLESVRAVLELVALGRPQPPVGSPRKLSTCLNWLLEGPVRCLPDDPDVLAAQKALEAANGAPR